MAGSPTQMPTAPGPGWSNASQKAGMNSMAFPTGAAPTNPMFDPAAYATMQQYGAPGGFTSHPLYSGLLGGMNSAFSGGGPVGSIAATSQADPSAMWKGAGPVDPARMAFMQGAIPGMQQYGAPGGFMQHPLYQQNWGSYGIPGQQGPGKV